MKTTGIRGYDIKPPKKSAFSIDTPVDMIRLHTLLLAVGKRGGGKSVAVSNLVENMVAQGVMDRVLLISPTYYSNKEICAPLNIKEDDIFEDPNKAAIQHVLDIVDAEREEYDTYVEDLKLYNAYTRDISSTKPVSQMSASMLINALERGWLENTTVPEKPEKKYPKSKGPPKLALIVDDAMATKLFQPSSGFVNLCIKHRHVGKGLGISIFILAQSYAAVGGVPRPIRGNATHLMLLKNKDTNQIAKICSEIGTDIDCGEFLKMFKYATAEPFGFLMIDFSPKSKQQTFRKNFNEYIV